MELALASPQYSYLEELGIGKWNCKRIPRAFANTAASPPTIQSPPPPFSSESSAPLPIVPLHFAKKKTAGSGGTAEGRQREAASAAGGHPRLRRPRLRRRCAASGPPPRALASPASLRPFPFSLLHHLVPRPLGRKGDKRGLRCRPAPHP